MSTPVAVSSGFGNVGGVGRPQAVSEAKQGRRRSPRLSFPTNGDSEEYVLLIGYGGSGIQSDSLTRKRNAAAVVEANSVPVS